MAVTLKKKICSLYHVTVLNQNLPNTSYLGLPGWIELMLRIKTFLDITNLVKRPPGNPILSSKPRLGRCQHSRPLKWRDKLPQDFLPLQIQTTGQRRDTCLKSKWQISVKCTIVQSLTAWTATVKLENKGERQFCVPVWSHSSRNSTIPAKTSSEPSVQESLLFLLSLESQKKGLHRSGLQKHPQP